MTTSSDNSDSSRPSRPDSTKTSVWIAVVLAALLAVTAGGVVPHLLGYGWFGHRPLLYGQGQLYLLNLTDEPHHVSVDGRTATEVSADNAAVVPLVGGDSTIEARDGSGQLVDQWQVHTRRADALVNLGADTCFVVARLSNLSGDEPLEVEIEQLVDADTSLVVMETNNTVWPRGYPGAVDDSRAPAFSVEIADCHLLDDPDFLGDYLQTRLRARM